MRSSHIDYLKSLIDSIKTKPELPATELVSLFPEDKILLVAPITADYPSLFPFCLIQLSPLTSIPDGRRFQKLSPAVLSGIKNLRYLKRHFSQEFTYSLSFWMQDSSKDVLSTGSVGSDVSQLGIVDQILLYIANHQKYKTSQDVTLEIRTGNATVVVDPLENLGYYKLNVEVVFQDGLFEIESVPTLAQGIFEIEEPTEIGTPEEQ
ncbi:hypothetical protein A0128_00925 [Leptospira tipperaryensis]|uniref:Uncharacterized protein n=1 Tax=Leptospira tipperaryensis TaxID=2564040 RepID=A0A1D7V1Y9_9LEPT|nr:hypothetical protein [Leptospira tipperaryensis]AOP35822.1 hypothetical protein A0128_00925 [Leptospira tipperaryensis]